MSVKNIPLSELTTEEKKDIIEFDQSQKIGGLGDMVDFSKLFEVKGIKGVYLKASKESKSGMISVVELFTTNKRIVKADKLKCLLDYRFYTSKNELVGINQMFNALNIYFIDTDVVYKNDCKQLMNLVIPNYHKDSFKPYHLKKVVNLYNLIKNKIIQIETK